MEYSARFTLAKGVMVELLGEDALVMVPGRDQVSLTGEGATVLSRIQLGEDVDAQHPALNHLIELGIVHVRAGVTRRGLVKAGAIGAGAGLTVFSLPSVAAASSTGFTIGGRYIYGARLRYTTDDVPWSGVISVFV